MHHRWASWLWARAVFWAAVDAAVAVCWCKVGCGGLALAKSNASDGHWAFMGVVDGMVMASIQENVVAAG